MGTWVAASYGGGQGLEETAIAGDASGVPAGDVANTMQSSAMQSRVEVILPFLSLCMCLHTGSVRSLRSGE